MDNKNRKGQIGIGDSPNIVLALVVIGIFLSVAALIMTEFQSPTTLNPNFNTAIPNETHSATTAPNQNITLDASGHRDFTINCDTLEVFNATGAAKVLTAGVNFTCLDSSYGKEFVNQVLINDTYGSTLNVSYTFTAKVQNYFLNSTDQTLEGLDTLSSFQTIIAVVVAAAIILGVVFLIRT